MSTEDASYYFKIGPSQITMVSLANQILVNKATLTCIPAFPNFLFVFKENFLRGPGPKISLAKDLIDGMSIKRKTVWNVVRP